MKYLLLALLFLLPWNAYAAVPSVAETPTTVSQASGTTLSTSHTASGTIAIVLLSHHYGADGVTGCTYGGVSMTRSIGSFVRSGAYIYYLANPAGGSQTVTCSFVGGASSRSSAMSIFSITGGDTSDPDHVTASANGNSTTPSVSQTTTKNDCLIVDAMAGNGNSTPTITGGQTSIYRGTITDGTSAARDWGQAREDKATAGSETASYSKASGEWEHVSASFCAASAAAASVTSDLILFE